MILIIDAGSSKVPQIEACVVNFGVRSFTKSISDFSKQDVERASHIIISGSPLLFVDRNLPELHSLGEKLFIPSKKILGICFGHQWMSLCHGGTVELGKASREPLEINLLKNSPLFENLSDTFVMAQDHCEHASLPKDFIHLASSEDCVNEAMQHKHHSFYGVQFHPEYSGVNGQTLINNFLKL